jgi:sodium/potassium-transporting ATPase subunit alpha
VEVLRMSKTSSEIISMFWKFKQDF